MTYFAATIHGSKAIEHRLVHHTLPQHNSRSITICSLEGLEGHRKDGAMGALLLTGGLLLSAGKSKRPKLPSDLPRPRHIYCTFLYDQVPFSSSSMYPKSCCLFTQARLRGTLVKLLGSSSFTHAVKASLIKTFGYCLSLSCLTDHYSSPAVYFSAARSYQAKHV